MGHMRPDVRYLLTRRRRTGPRKRVSWLQRPSGRCYSCATAPDSDRLPHRRLEFSTSEALPRWRYSVVRGEDIRPLVLIRHARPLVDPGLPARAWTLSDEGREAARALVGRVRPLAVTRVVSSVEPKAWETGAIVAQRLGVPCSAAPGLHEHDREGAPFLAEEQFQAAMEALFERPDALVFGRETANQARDRFAAAVDAVLAEYPDDTVAISSHATVISLLAALRRGVGA